MQLWKPLIVALIFLSTTHCCESQSIAKLEYPLDMVLLLDSSGSINRPDYYHMLDVVRQLPDYFSMGENHTRVAVIMFHSWSVILVNLTHDEKEIRSLNQTQYTGGTDSYSAFKDARDKVFVASRPEAEKIIILITDGGPDYRMGTERVAAELRNNNGCLIYAAFIKLKETETRFTNEQVMDHLRNVTGNPTHVFPLANFSELTATIFNRIQDSVREVLRCEFTEKCRFNSTELEGCVSVWYQPNAGDKPCNKSKPATTNLHCDVRDCQQTCDELWPWEQLSCTITNGTGEKISRFRQGAMKVEHKAVLDWCPTVKEVTCQRKEIVGARFHQICTVKRATHGLDDRLDYCVCRCNSGADRRNRHRLLQK